MVTRTLVVTILFHLLVLLHRMELDKRSHVNNIVLQLIIQKKKRIKTHAKLKGTHTSFKLWDKSSPEIPFVMANPHHRDD